MTRFIGITVRIIFIQKFASKTFADHLNHKTANKTTRRMPSANPGQLWPNLLKSFRTVAIAF